MANYRAKSINDGKYIKWLSDHVGGSMYEYGELFEYLANKEFIWILDRDQNRAFDGRKLRDIYTKQGHVLSKKWNDRECTVLEMLVGLSIRIETDIMGEPDDDHPEKWFWIMLENLGIEDQNDDNFDEPFVDRLVDVWLRRKFVESGIGSIFPLKRPETDQREVEIWDQMNHFLNENYI